MVHVEDGLGGEYPGREPALGGEGRFASTVVDPFGLDRGGATRTGVGTDRDWSEVDLVAASGAEVSDGVPGYPAAGFKVVESVGDGNGQGLLGQRGEVGRVEPSAQQTGDPHRPRRTPTTGLLPRAADRSDHRAGHYLAAIQNWGGVGI